MLIMPSVDILGESQLVGYPSQVPSIAHLVSSTNSKKYPSVSELDYYRNGAPNARYWVLKMLIDFTSLGDQLVSTTSSDRYGITTCV
jgi:hypothetical protein